MKLKDFLTLKVGAGVLISGTRYKPYINYSWSQPLTVGGNQQIKDTGTSGLNLQQFFGQGCWFNGIDMQITVPVNATIQTEIKRVNGVVKINTNIQNLTNYNVYSGSGAKVYKDLYLFNRALVSTEIEKYNNQPNQFFMDSLEDGSCVLAMPMCEKNNLVRNYKNNTDYPITNYLTTCRTNAQRLPYGLQTSGLKRDSNGLILSKSNFLEADGVGYSNTGWIPSVGMNESVEMIIDSSKNSIEVNGNEFNYGISIGSNSGTENNIYIKVHGAVTQNRTSAVGINYVVITTKEDYKFNVFINSILSTSNVAYPSRENSIYPFWLGDRAFKSLPATLPIRLFKVHQKTLTQEEVSKNFNKYQAQGLLNE